MKGGMPLLALMILISAPACSGRSAQEDAWPPGTPADGAAVDLAPSDASSDLAGDGPTCDEGLTLCNGTCVDLMTDDDNCGSCASACNVEGGECCDNGVCSSDGCGCLDPSCCCPGIRTDCNSDPNNCGSCGNVCDVDSGFMCISGVCDCTGDATNCGGSCVDTSSNSEHCGGCDQPCDIEIGFVCQNGQCNCISGMIECDGQCTNTANDPNNCGDCGIVCEVAAGDVCVGGSCSGLCGYQVLCDGECVDLQTDANNCLGCGNVCTGGKICMSGCICPPSSPVECNGVCINPQVDDPNNCGACGKTCNPGEPCINGICGCGPCPCGLDSCDGQCVDLQTDPGNCGSCGAACDVPSGEECYRAECVPACPGTICGDRCVDTSSHQFNCGACSVACNGEWSLVCENGKCVCGHDMTWCNGKCVYTDSDIRNCGSCGSVCTVGKVCAGGVCQCPSGHTECDGVCVNTMIDSLNCGSCGATCGDSTNDCCVGGVCTSDCNCPPWNCCCGLGISTDCSTDPDNCGTCGNVCTGGEVCAGGVCQCPANMPDKCDGVCTDIYSDPFNCGGCCNVCDVAAGEVCLSGECYCGCPPGQVCCDYVCVSLATDGSNCGTCGNICPDGMVCVGGQCNCPSTAPYRCYGDCTDKPCDNCTPECPSGETCVDGTCLACTCQPYLPCCEGCPDTNANSENCGGCGVKCPPDRKCQGGACVCAHHWKTDCNGKCSDLWTDSDNCGGCGLKCGTSAYSRTCTGGKCICSHICTDPPIDLASDPANCGSCGNTCAPGETCSDGLCDPCSNVCDGNCTDLTSDPDNCGDCGNTCTFADVLTDCVDGECAPYACTPTGAIEVCDGIDNDCNGFIDDGFDLSADPDNCGACGIICAPDQACQGGLCACIHPAVVENCADGWCTIPAGCFLMGAPAIEPCRCSKETLHQATLTHAFEMSATEVTQGEFQALMGYNPSEFTSCGGNCPVETVNMHEAMAYCNALSDQAGLDKCYSCVGSGASVTCSETLTYSGAEIYICPGYRLPSEAEWEYAYRAGSTTPFYPSLGNDGTIAVCSDSGDPNADKIGWHSFNSAVTYAGCYGLSHDGGDICSGTHPVGQKDANAWGLYDMAGNVMEWCHGYYGDYGNLVSTDPWEGDSVTYTVSRGGAWIRGPGSLRAAYREPPALQMNAVGFRCVRTLNP